MAVLALTQGYTSLSIVMALAAAGLGAFALWQLARMPSTGAAEPVPVAHRVPLILLTLLPFSIWAFGLVAASAAFALFWVLRWEDGRPRNLVTSLAVAVAVAALTALYLDRFAVVRLPDPAILGLF
jgi:hypothetical protein